MVNAGSVTSAGRELGRSQPVVSRQVSDLEAELGFVLFERTRPTITLTAPGRAFYQEARNILADLQQLESHVQDMRAGQLRPLRILATSDLAHGLLPEALARIDRFGAVFDQRLIVEEVVHETTFRDFTERQADFALVNLPIEGEALHVHWCGRAACQLALPAGHPLASQDTIALHDVRETDVITLLSRYRLRFQLTSSLARATLRGARRQLEVGSQQSALAMVRAGLGVALMDPFSLCGARLEGVVMRPIQTEIPYIIGVVSQLNHGLPDGADRLIRGLHSYIQQMVPGYVDSGSEGLQALVQRSGQAAVSA